MSFLRTTIVVLLLALASGCGGAATPPDSDAGADQPESIRSEPSPEPTGPEQPQPRLGDRPAFNDVRLPVGGSAKDAGDGLQCASAGWLGSRLPDGVTVTISSIRLSRKGVFELDSSACSGPYPICAPGVALNSGCLIGARYIGGSGSVLAEFTGRIGCPDQATCDRLVAGLGGGGIEFRAFGPGTPDTRAVPPTPQTPGRPDSVTSAPVPSEPPTG